MSTPALLLSAVCVQRGRCTLLSSTVLTVWFLLNPYIRTSMLRHCSAAGGHGWKVSVSKRVRVCGVFSCLLKCGHSSFDVVPLFENQVLGSVYRYCRSLWLRTGSLSYYTSHLLLERRCRLQILLPFWDAKHTCCESCSSNAPVRKTTAVVHVIHCSCCAGQNTTQAQSYLWCKILKYQDSSSMHGTVVLVHTEYILYEVLYLRGTLLLYAHVQRDTHTYTCSVLYIYQVLYHTYGALL